MYIYSTIAYGHELAHLWNVTSSLLIFFSSLPCSSYSSTHSSTDTRNIYYYCGHGNAQISSIPAPLTTEVCYLSGAMHLCHLSQGLWSDTCVDLVSTLKCLIFTPTVVQITREILTHCNLRSTCQLKSKVKAMRPVLILWAVVAQVYLLHLLT